MSQPLAPKRKTIVPSFDPEVQPVLAPKARLTPLPLQILQADFVRAAFTTPVAWDVEPVFSEAFRIDTDSLNQAVQAAVLFPLVQRESGLQVLLTRRSPNLSAHPGQISFPGGRIEPSDGGPLDAALRETYEEIGVAPGFVEVWGRHPNFLTGTGFAMEPVIGLIRDGFEIKPDITEVAEVFEVPLSFLMDPANHRLHAVTLPDGKQRLYFSMPWGPYFIWGATAALIRNLYHHLAAAQRVLTGTGGHQGQG